MTEAEWLTCDDPATLLEFLHGKTSERKLRLFACGCCRRLWHLLVDGRSRKGVEVAEQYADGVVTDNDRATAYAAAHAAYRTIHPTQDPYSWSQDGVAAFVAAAAAAPADAFAHLAETLTSAGPRYSSVHVVSAAENAACCIASSKVGSTVHAAYCLSFDTECNEQCRMLRDIMPNPLLLVNLHPSWLMHVPSLLSWNNGTIPMLAQSIYDDRAFDRLPILADALEEAGCTETDIIQHCRHQGEHVRGCWLVDLLLGKK